MHVLVVDDNPKMADYAVQFLMLYGRYSTEVALNVEALNQA